jgi:hypothetical protein
MFGAKSSAVNPGSGASAASGASATEFATPPTAAGATRLAFLATLGHLHTLPLRYDLACIHALVEQLQPDLLGVEVEVTDWESGDLAMAPVEVRNALVPASRLTDTVVVPLAAPSHEELSPPGGDGVRSAVYRATDALFNKLQRTSAAGGAPAVNSPLFGHVCGLLCAVEEAAASEAGRHAWEETNRRILERLLEMVRRNPGRRVLVAVNCKRVHWLVSQLRPLHQEITLVPYTEL